MNQDKQGLLEHLEKLGFFARWREENPFKIKAFDRAVENLEKIPEKEIFEKIKKNQLTEIEGVGKGIAQIAKDFAEKGSSEELKKLQAELPEDLIELQKLPGLGVKKIKALYEKLGIKSLGELEYACKENRLLQLEGFGEKTQQKIIQEIARLNQQNGKILVSEALDLAQELESKFTKGVLFKAVGALGMRREIISKLEYLFIQTSKKAHPLQPEANSKTVEFHLKSGIPVVFYFTDEESFIVESIFRTSSEDHWESIKARAEEAGFHITEDFQVLKNSKPQKIESEEEFYQQLGLTYHPPESREFKASSQSLELVEGSALTGVFHAHSHFSDGKNSLEEMATAAQNHGWKFFGISEHSQTAFYAHGLKEERLASYFEEIKRLNQKLKNFRIFAGIESDILKDGALDYPKAQLDQFDFVIASIHQRYGMKDMTDRLIRAIENPATRFVGHLSGRLLLGRDPYSYQLEKIVRTAIAKNVAIELNASPQRLDIDWRELRIAAQAGLLISINPDAHSVAGLSDVDLGVIMARKAEVPSSQIINTWSFEKVEKFLSGKVSA